MAKKKKKLVEVTITENRFPFIGLGSVDDKRYQVKNVLKGQRLKVKEGRVRKDKIIGKMLEVIERAPYEGDSNCIHFPECGGCLMQMVPYQKQLQMAEDQILNLLKENGLTGFEYDGIIQSPNIYNYRNKMEYTFGNAEKDGEMTLGMHPRGRFHDIINTFECRIAPEDFNKIQKFTLEYFLGKGVDFYNKYSHEGFLRHLLLRQGMKTNEILVGISTTSQMAFDFTEYVQELKNLKIDGKIVGIIHVTNDRLADALIPEKQTILFGRDYYMDEIHGLSFQVSLFSFFQTNPLGAELLYEKGLSYINELEGKVVYDLFSGTGTIGQLAAQKAKRVYGIELIEEAVFSANENAKRNNIENCTFIAGDVFEKLDELKEKPDAIILDPPRMGVSEKALEKIINFSIDEIVYISCNPKTFAENAVQLKAAGYEIKQLTLVDMFPHTAHVETVSRLSLKSQN